MFFLFFYIQADLKRPVRSLSFRGSTKALVMLMMTIWLWWELEQRAAKFAFVQYLRQPRPNIYNMKVAHRIGSNFEFRKYENFSLFWIPCFSLFQEWRSLEAVILGILWNSNTDPSWISIGWIKNICKRAIWLTLYQFD